MGFPVLRARDNPLAGLAGGFFEGFTPAYQNRMQEEKRSKGWNSALDLLNKSQNGEENPLEIYRALSALDPSDRKDFLGLYEAQAKQKADRLKEQQRISQVAKEREPPPGLPQKYHDLWRYGTEGARTEIIKAVLDQEARGEDEQPMPPQARPSNPFEQLQPEEPIQQFQPPRMEGSRFGEFKPEGIEKPPIQRQPEKIGPEKTLEKGFEYAPLPKERLTPKERAVREKDRYNKQLDIYQKDKQKLESAEREQLETQRLVDLNNRRNLPEGAERWNVDSNGKLRMPAAANAETQLFVKTVNGFLDRAKDTFGSRLTDFDVKSFMQRLPTLANTYEGRKLILSQMQIGNEMMLLEKNALMDAFDHYGGVRKVDYDFVEREAKRKIKPEMEELKRRYRDLDGQLNIYEKEQQKIEQEEVNRLKADTPIGNNGKPKVLFRAQDGRFGWIEDDPHKIEKAKEKGFERI